MSRRNTYDILQWEDVRVGLEVKGSCLKVRMGSHFLVPEITCPGYSQVLPSRVSKTIAKTLNLLRLAEISARSDHV